MEPFKYKFGLDKPQDHNILQRWECVLTIPISALKALCTHEYRICILIEFEVPISSGEGYHGLADERENIWARSVLNMRQEVPPITRGQLEPSSWSRYLQDLRI